MHSDRVGLSDQINKYLLSDRYEGVRLNPGGWERRAAHTSYVLRNSSGNAQRCLSVKGKENKTLEFMEGICGSFTMMLCCSQRSCEHHQWSSFPDETSRARVEPFLKVTQ